MGCWILDSEYYSALKREGFRLVQSESMQFVYDAAGRTAAVTDALGSRTQYFYDAAGRQTAVRDALGREVKYQYDALGRKIRTIFPDGTTAGVVYNTLGQKTEETDQAGISTKFEYDAVGRLASVVKPEVTDPESGNLVAPRWSYTYDMYGRQVKITDPKGRETKFAYDELGRQRSRTLPLGQSESRTYNTLGQLEHTTDFMSQSTAFVYDNFGRLQSQQSSGAIPVAISYSYDTMGRQYQVTDSRGITEYGYDTYGRLISVASPEGTINYEYSTVTGRKTRTWTVNSDQRYTYDELGRLKTVAVHKRNGVALGSPEVTTYSYTKVGSRAAVALPNGVTTEYAYDNLNRLTNVSHLNSANQLLAGFAYTLAPNGRRAGVHEQRLETGNQYSNTDIAYTYDSLNRLALEASSSDVPELNYSNAYTYDLVGNRLQKTGAGHQPGVISYSYNSNDQLLTETSSITGQTSYSYDANGSLIQKASTSESDAYTYNAINQMVGANIQRTENGQAVNISANYAYNHAGIRVKADSTVNGIANNQVFLVDQMNHTGYAQVLEELNATGGSAVKSYVIGDDILSQSSVTGIRHFCYDGHGSTRLLTDNSGAITSRYGYDAYGISVAGNPNVTSPAETNLLYSGEQFDHSLQMQYLRARYYDQNNGRFNSLDPFGGNNDDPQSLHKYAYCQAEPVNGIDPSGMSTAIELGMLVHTEWGEEYRAIHFPDEVKLDRCLEGTLFRPDIVNHTRCEAYEIKPLSDYGLSTGPAQLAGYLAILNAGGKMYIPGISYQPRGEIRPLISAPGNFYIQIMNVSGVLYYKLITPEYKYRPITLTDKVYRKIQRLVDDFKPIPEVLDIELERLLRIESARTFARVGTTGIALYVMAGLYLRLAGAVLTRGF